MTADELEELIKKLLAKGVTVIVLVAGSAGQLTGSTPGGEPAPPAIDAPSTATPAPTAPPLATTDPATPDTGTTPEPTAPPRPSPASPLPVPGTTEPDSSTLPDIPSSETGDPPATLPAPTGAPRATQAPVPSTAAPSASTPDPTPPAPGQGQGVGRVPTVDPDGTWSDGTGGTGQGTGGTGQGGGTGNGAGSGGGNGGAGQGTGGTGGTGQNPAGDGDGNGTGTGGSGQGTTGTGQGTGGTGQNGGVTGQGSGSGNGTGTGGSSGTGSGSGSGSGTDGTATTGDGGTATGTGQGVTAAQKYGWGNPVRADDFTGGTEGWNIYDGAGHAGNGRRTPDAVSIQDGVLTITGDSQGSTAGMAWMPGQKYGRWEGRVKAPASDPSYNALLLLWPDAENFPEGGELDFMEMMDHTRQKTNLFLHYGADNSQVSGDVNIDATQWHNWAVEWTPQGVTAYVDGEQWWHTDDTSILPPGPMHLCIQLDWFPKGGDVTESQMHVDWVKQYALDDAGGAQSGETGESGETGRTGGGQQGGTQQDDATSDTRRSGTSGGSGDGQQSGGTD